MLFFATRVDGTLYYIHTDHLGSTSLVTDDNGNEVNRILYSPYGSVISSTGSLPTDRLYTGQRREQSLGLYDYRARFYDPLVGSFLSPDTIVPELGRPAAFNRYGYVYGNPVRYTDPSGHCISGTIDTLLCVSVLTVAVVVGIALDPADVLAPDDTMAANPPPTNPGFHPAPYIRDYENGAYVAGTIGLATEFIPFNDIPGVKPILKGAGNAVVEAMFDFGWKAEFVQKLRPQQYGTFGDTWGWLAHTFNESGTERKLFAYYNEAGEITGGMYIKGLQNGALYIDRLEGLGGGAGTALFKQAILESQRNYSGGIVLISTPGAYDWYMKFNPTKVEGGFQFYWSPEDAAKLLE